MQIVSSRLHGVLDYLTGALLVAAPYLAGFDNARFEHLVPVTAGVCLLLYSLFTNYPTSMTRLIPMRMHLLLDVIAGSVVATSPWAFGFARDVWAPHLAIGLFVLVYAFGSAAQVRTAARPSRVIRAHHHAGEVSPVGR